jgi:hypothetical protein
LFELLPLQKQRQNDLPKSDLIKINRKCLPSNSVLTQYDFRNPGFTLAHLYMQDGGLHVLSSVVSTPMLYIQMNIKQDCQRLAHILYQMTGLKYIVKPRTKDQKTIWYLYLCPSSINSFISFGQSYIHPTFLYKMPKHLNSTWHKELVQRYEKLFELQRCF